MNKLLFKEENSFIDGQKEKMEKVIFEFMKSINNEEKIFVFGAGKVARRLYKEFERNNKSKKIQAFLVSNQKSNGKELNGIPVREYMDFKDESEKILIGLWETEQENVYFELVKNGINKSRIIRLPFIVNRALDFFDKESEKWEGSIKYWEERYQNGGNSGAGSYNRLAEFKAEIINEFVKKHKINSVIEWGCGDGNQLLFADYMMYIGYDISEKAIEICSKKYKEDKILIGQK